MKSSYKSGSSSALDLILSSASFEELSSNIYYLDKVSEADAEAISEVQDLANQLAEQQSQLQAQQDEQEAKIEATQQSVDDYTAQVSEAQDYYNSLDTAVQEQLAKEAEEAQQENAAASGVAAAVATAESANGAVSTSAADTSSQSSGSESSSSSSSSNSSSESSSNPSSNSSSSNSGSSSSGGSSSSSSSGGGSKTYSSSVIANAAQFIGYLLSGEMNPHGKWISYPSVRHAGGLKVGDIIRMEYTYDGEAFCHSAVVYSVDGDTVLFLQAAGGSYNKLRIRRGFHDGHLRYVTSVAKFKKLKHLRVCRSPLNE